MGDLLAALVGSVLLLSAVAELVACRIAKRPPEMSSGKTCAVVVLGYPSLRSGRPHPVQKWRTRIGVRTLAQTNDGWLVFTGAATKGAKESEAETMAWYANAVLDVPRDRIMLESEARSTWENVRNTIPLTEAAQQIAIASDPLHAEKAQMYLQVQRPDLADRVVRSANYRFLERWWMKIPALLNYAQLRARKRFGTPPPDFSPS